MADNKKHQKPTQAFEIERLNPHNITWINKKLIHEHLERYKFAADFCKNKIVVELGCGIGYGSEIIAQKGAKKVFAFDIDPDAIKIAKSKYKRKNLVYKIKDAQKTKLSNNSTDVVISFETIEHLKNPDNLVKEIYRILKPNGICILSTPNKAVSFSDNPYHIREFTLKELKVKFQSFAKLSCYGQRKVNLTLINFYQYLHRIIPWKKIKFLLKLRPWENYKIMKVNQSTNPPYLYLLIIAKK